MTSSAEPNAGQATASSSSSPATLLPKLFASRLNLKSGAATTQSTSDAAHAAAAATGSSSRAQQALQESVQAQTQWDGTGEPRAMMDGLQVTLSDGAAGVVQFGRGRFEIVRVEAKPAGLFAGPQGNGKHVLTTDLLNVLSLQLDIDCPAGPSDMADLAPTATPHPVPKERTLLPKLGAGLRLASSTRLRAPPASAKGAFIVKIDALARKGGALRLVSVFVRVASGVGAEEVDGWIARAMATAYPASKPARSILLLVNPVGGKGKARHIVDTAVLPILRAAGCTVDVVETSHSKHAEEIARETKLDYDIIAAASGDGLIHEVINGFATRPDARTALGIPIVPIPTGSANGLAINLFGVKDTFNVPLACLNAIKGQPLPLDLCAIVRRRAASESPAEAAADGEGFLERRWSFMSQAMGLMCDLDLGTENMRWMGDARFVVGFLKGIVANRPMRCRIHIDARVSSKALMIQQLNARRAAVHRSSIAPVAERGLGPETPEKDAEIAEPDSAVGGMQPADRDSADEPGIGEAGEDSFTAAATNAFVIDDDDKESVVAPATPSEPPAAVAAAPVADTDLALPAIRLLEPQASWITIESGDGYDAADKNPQGDNGKAAPVGVGPEDKRASETAAPSSAWQDGVGALYIYAGLVPYVARDLMQFPVAMPGEGVVDVVVQGLVPRATLANAITGAEKGKQFYMDCQHYYKARAYVVEPLDPGALVSIDGEKMPFERFSVEVHPRLARTMSLLGGWADGGFGREE